MPLSKPVQGNSKTQTLFEKQEKYFQLVIKIIIIEVMILRQNKNFHTLMNKLFFIIISVVCISCSNSTSHQPKGLKTCKSNPNYLEYKGKPIFIASSSEHYGSVYNLDFDYVRQLETLKAEGLNFTKFFTGLWRLPEKNVFNITESPFITRDGRHATPFLEVNGKYDLNQWNPVFFERLHGMLTEAEKRDIIVEITLFCVFYDQASWETSVFWFKNNINNLDSLDYKRVFTPFNGNMWPYQEKLVRKMVQEVNKYPNCYFEIQNEPWSDNPNLQGYVNFDNDSVYKQKWQKMVEVGNDAALAWQRKISAVIVDEESKLPNKHLISQNIGNFSPKINNPDPNVSIFNFHYALPTAASDNLHLKKVMAINETGFMPQNDFNYRREAWQFVLAGGGIYNNLDYSFLPGKEDGSHKIIDLTPGWGGKEYRRQVRFMGEIIRSVPFYGMQPMQSIIHGATSKSVVQVLGQKGKVYVVYVFNPTNEPIAFEIPNGKYTITVSNPATSQQLSENMATITDGKYKAPSSAVGKELVLVIKQH